MSCPLSCLTVLWTRSRGRHQIPNGGGLNIQYTTKGGVFLSYCDETPAVACIWDVLYADNLATVAETQRELQHMVNVLDGACTRWGMTISGGKTKLLAVEERTAT